MIVSFTCLFFDYVFLMIHNKRINSCFSPKKQLRICNTGLHFLRIVCPLQFLLWSFYLLVVGRPYFENLQLELTMLVISKCCSNWIQVITSLTRVVGQGSVTYQISWIPEQFIGCIFSSHEIAHANNFDRLQRQWCLCCQLVTLRMSTTVFILVCMTERS